MTPKRILMYKTSLFLFFCCCASQAAAVNTLNQGDSLNSTDTLVSNNGLFTLGFYGFENSDSIYLGIWNSNSPGKPFWLALDTPVANNSALLTLDTTGELKLASGSGDSLALYSAQSATNVTAVLQDSGNFVLQPVNSVQILWQSFDSPTDSFLPGMKLGFNHKTGKNWSLRSWLTDSIPAPGAFTLEWNPVSRQLVVRRRGVIFWTSGVLMSNNTFENIRFDEALLSNNFFNVSNADEDYLMFSIAKTTYAPSDLMNFSMLTLKPEGPILDQNSNRLFSVACNGNSTDYGCQRWEGPTCRGDHDTFALRAGYFLPSVSRHEDDNASLTSSDCKDLCWKDCNCVGISYYHANRTGCILYYGPFNQDLTGNAIQFQVIVQDAGSSPSGGNKWIWISIAIVVALIVILLGIFFYLRRRRIKQKEKFLEELMTLDRPSDANELEIDGNKGHNLKVYDVASIMAATNSFSLETKLGEGGFGPVYKGQLVGGREIAVKRLSRRSGQGLVEFRNELILIAKLQHTNLVRVLGCCIQGEEKMLVYEYMPNKSLDSFIFNESKKGLVDWKKRFSIIEGIGQGLLYLHKYSRLRIIHRDLKVSNILLDENMNPKISDFGMARIFNTNDSEANTSRIAGTFGYMSPEYVKEGIFSVKSDVFSFGVLVLEIVSGRKTDRRLSLVGYAWELWKEGAAIELLDPTLRDSCSKDQVLRCINIGLLCVEDSASDRPTMSDVISMLTSEATPLPNPKHLPFSTASSTIESKIESTNECTMSVMNAR